MMLRIYILIDLLLRFCFRIIFCLHFPTNEMVFTIIQIMWILSDLMEIKNNYKKND